MTPKIVLTIAGSDSSGGAGIQADIKAISALGGYAASAITAITAQNTKGVQNVMPLPTENVEAQISSVFDDLNVDAVKIGMVFNSFIIETIAKAIDKYNPRNIVFDPVMISTSGHKLIADDTIDSLKALLIPRATLITPNLHEARLLFGYDINTIEQMDIAATRLAEQYHTSVLIKGGHLDGDRMCDVLCQLLPDNTTQISHHILNKVESKNLHGTGCTLSSAIATLLAQEYSMPESVRLAKAYVNNAIAAAKNHKIGSANGPVWHFHNFYKG